MVKDFLALLKPFRIVSGKGATYYRGDLSQHRYCSVTPLNCDESINFTPAQHAEHQRGIPTKKKRFELPPSNGKPRLSSQRGRKSSNNSMPGRVSRPRTRAAIPSSPTGRRGYVAMYRSFTWLCGGGEPQHPLAVRRPRLPPAPTHPGVEGRRFHVPETVRAVRRDRRIHDLLSDVVLW